MALPDLVPVEDFCGAPERAGATISPDGTRIACLAPWRDRLNVWVQGLDPSGGFDGEPDHHVRRHRPLPLAPPRRTVNP
ncbi:hypothetical protein [Nocardiopsis alborubida]|uniref:Uncharacterized protein n=1 Tax=Nocardiopsis alborubida TaxID=146802 RepID=A0A7X6RQJ6_9ACTN|nr:hypothetical protein [Nocardiopsis alborubida]NKY98859.1 hypothetical protein [Nocardiopsis alborubida]